MSDLLRALDGDANGDDLASVVALLRIAAPIALERLAALAVWKRVYEAERPASRNGGDRKSAAYRKKNQNEKFSFCSVAAQQLGLTERSIQLDVQTAAKLGVRDIKRLWDGPIADNQAALRTVSELDEVHRDALFGVWTDNPKLSFDAALIAARIRAEKDSAESKFRKLLDAFTRCGRKERRRLVALHADEIRSYLDEVTA